MSSASKMRSIGSLLSDHFSGAWGSDPSPTLPNATVLRSTDIDDEGHVDLSRGAQRHLSSRDLSSRRLLRGDILLEASGGGPGKPVGRPAWFSDEAPCGDYATSNFFKVLRADAKAVDAKFLLYALVRLVKRPEIWRFQQQTTGITNLKFSEYLKHEIAVPPPGEQRRIAEILDTLDDQISATDRIVAKMLTTRHGLVERLISQEVPNAILGSALLSAPANGIYKPAHLIGHGALLVGQTAINSDRRVIPSLARRGEVVPIELQRFGLIAGDILVSRVYATLDGVGQPALVEHLGEDSVFESNMMRLRCNGSKADPFFIFQSLLTSSARAHVVRRANLSNQASISQAVLTELPVWIPNIEHQLYVGRAIRSVETGIEAERARVTKLRALKAGLMDDLLPCRVRVTQGAAS